jgi:hypothetical protein
VQVSGWRVTRVHLVALVRAGPFVLSRPRPRPGPRPRPRPGPRPRETHAQQQSTAFAYRSRSAAAPQPLRMRVRFSMRSPVLLATAAVRLPLSVTLRCSSQHTHTFLAVCSPTRVRATNDVQRTTPPLPTAACRPLLSATRARRRRPTS